MADNNRVLVIAAHPDDEVLGCGGVIAKYAEAGKEVFVLILGEGLAARYNGGERPAKESLNTLKEQAKKAANMLGVKEVYFEDLPDNSFDSVPLLRIIKIIERVKDRIKPGIVYTHHIGDLNIDHRITLQAVLTSCRPLPGETVKEIYSFEIPSSTEWEDGMNGVFTPNVYIDISETIDKKLKAFESYESEIKEWPHPRSIKGVEVMAQKRGAETGIEHAEAFMLIRSVRSDR